MDNTDLEKAMEKLLPERRYRHSLGVEYTAGALAMRYGAATEKALIAGILHDCAKAFRGNDIIRRCDECGISLTDTERSNTALIHAKLGAYMAEHNYGVQDEEIISAIRWHTTGRPGMTLLEKIVFTADYIEPHRDRADNLPEIREMAFNDLDRAVAVILEQTLEFLKGCGNEIDPGTQEAYDYYSELIKNRE
ncbi:MAG: bis(5'-nucleosyl)-tetraphosphatase (symmetrical) YqeK [Lachnospiraceae bacterium]|nr:bis(5'-nucleosyl)-tetraphosphatase (symmetrical) YqeK [Lachnospiraceae bacterium]